MMIECCEDMILLLDTLLNEGQITREEYEKHVFMKKKFLKMQSPDQKKITLNKEMAHLFRCK